MHKTLKALVRLFMLKNNLTQTQMAEAVGVTQSTISGWAFNESEPIGIDSDALDRIVVILQDAKLMNAIANPATVKRFVLTSETSTGTRAGRRSDISKRPIRQDPVIAAILQQGRGRQS